HLDHQIGGAVDHLRHVGEIGGAVDEAAEPQTAAYAVEIAAGRDLQVRDDVEGAETRRLLSVGDADRGAELADKAALAIPLADLAGDENEIARHRERHVIGEGRGRLRQFDAELLEPRLDLSAHRLPLTNSSPRIGPQLVLSSPPRNRRIRCVVPSSCAHSDMSCCHCCSLRVLLTPRLWARRKSVSPPTACWSSTGAATVGRSGPCRARSATSRRSRGFGQPSCCMPTIRSAKSW